MCDKLGIAHYTLNCQEQFKKQVVEDFIHGYEACKTPNPCIECNQYLKFGIFYQKAKELGCNYIATGHYAKIEYDPTYQEYVLKKAKAEKKDQSYFLYRIPKNVLSHTLFPLAEFEEKNQIRSIAQNHQLKIAHKPDSQEVCFIPDNNYGDFLKRNGKQKIEKGPIRLEDGTILGEHKGLIHYTIGQRKGLGISYREPLYVLGFNPQDNALIVGPETKLYKEELYACDLNFLLDRNKIKDRQLKAKIRYRAEPAIAHIQQQQNSIKVIFKEKQRAITPGQSIVFYLEDIVVGGGKIQ